ncbi:hypothetical protein T265_05324 [Opisthorchis viverrini]|uniref:Uncharacterized protein n=1 Tax=Opisthorchis viverrini TaxID=6198 RepID=A0A074ZPH8_OPIVI|nr:hypothetical protein T265_05324 [Opisthorchis viverrini]KER27697.1 hypothetical protein T265_05324 [Opisthorchis viverrini]
MMLSATTALDEILTTDEILHSNQELWKLSRTPDTVALKMGTTPISFDNRLSLGMFLQESDSQIGFILRRWLLILLSEVNKQAMASARTAYQTLRE